MNKVARRSLKGYSYQQSVFALFLSIMDTERNIAKITAEALDTKNFDDIYIEYVADEKKSYRIQVKNYPNVTIKDILITEHILSIIGNDNEFVPTDNNVLIVNTAQITGTESFMGLPCTKLKNIIIIPLTPEQIADRMDDMFCSEAREVQIIHKANDIVQNSKFEISIDELPDLIEMSTGLDDRTILLRKIPDFIEKTVTFIEGKPGVGKSHFVNEICEKYPDAIVYRFWTGSQDPNINKRIRFEDFILEFGVKVFRSAKKVYIEELVDTIQKQNRLIVIDGLDHVENYNPQQLQSFINFIDRLKNTRTIVLSRPLRYTVPWQKVDLLDWTEEETRVYLEVAHEIFEYQIQQQIYDVSGGYPIITHFLAEDYKLNQEINLTLPIASINDYYDTLFINNEHPSDAISIFASGNCFFTWKELESFFTEPEMYAIIREFIERHPYLFKVIRNRISLIHDSFNTYLRTKIEFFAQRQAKTIAIIRESLLSGSVEYMARMESFKFDNEFYLAMIKKYSIASSLTELMLSTRDYNSISSLYVQLRRLLEARAGVLNIYEYYSFALLFQVATRNDLIGHDSLVYQMLLYMHSHEGIEDNIFSSDYIWHVYLVCRGAEKYAEQYLTNRHISDGQYYDLINHLNEDRIFYEKKDNVISYNDLEAKFKDHRHDLIVIGNALTDYLISIWIHGKTGDKYLNEFKKYVAGNNDSCIDIITEMSQYGLDEHWTKRSLNAAKYQLHELGFFGDNNQFRRQSLHKLILENAPRGSFEVTTLAASFLKLANHENREVDISSLAYCWSMYYNRKDYSVFTIDEALLAFESKELISWEQSFTIIDRLMKQSEKGISHLLTSYLNKKEPECMQQIKEAGGFNNRNSPIRFWGLIPEHYDCFSKSEIIEQVIQLLGSHSYSHKIESRDIQNIIKSKHRDLVLSGIKHFGYAIFEPDEDLIPTLDEIGVEYEGKKEEEEAEYIPFRHGSISERDFGYIAEQNIGYLEVSGYADGWYSCLPFVNVFSIYPKAEIQQDYISIIHRSLFARVSDNDYIGNWYQIIGNIPAFLMQYEIDVDWRKIYSIFNSFMDLSLIYRIAS